MDELVQDIFNKLKQKGWMIACAESCTGGLIAARITDVAGSSEFFDRGFTTYSNKSKTEMLGVPAEMITAHGAVSEEVAKAMAEGVLKNSRAKIGVSTTGIAGPGGGTATKPVGLVFIGVATPDKTEVFEHRFTGNRETIRLLATHQALKHVAAALA